MKELKIVFLLCSVIFFTGCGSSSSSDSDTVIVDDSSDSTSDDITSSSEVDMSKFSSETVSYTEVDCTLTNGESSTCYEITIKGFPANRDEVGPNCPSTITTDTDNSGKWFDNGILYDATGDFIKNLDTFYGDSNWKLYDETTGEVYITDTQEACEAAARPDVDAAYNNYCVECDINYFSDNDSGGVTTTFTIPKIPVYAESSSSIGTDGVGIALDGVKMDAAAPTEAILSAYTIAAFDDCVGHVNPTAGYHYHGANQGDGTCPSIDFESDGHAGMIGYALDGYPIYGMLDEDGNETEDLDSCRGHVDELRGYHYHSAGAGENTFIGCFKGKIVVTDDNEEGGMNGTPPDNAPDNTQTINLTSSTK